MRKLKQLFIELFGTKEFIRYFISGVVATVVNVGVYMLLNRSLGLERWYLSNAPAIILSVLAAYVLNRIWVFRSTSDVWTEFVKFVGTRLLISFFFEYVGIFLIRNVLNIHTEIIPGMIDIAKLIALAFVVIGNRVVGKFYVFKDQGDEHDGVREQALETIRSAHVFADHDSRQRVVQLERRLGDPWRAFPSFHVAGTNGKGSICSFLAHMLCEAGHRVGWYTSPYLERFNERIRVLDGPDDLARYDDDQTYGEIPDEAIARLMETIEAAAMAVVEDGGEPPTQFDLMTALAFMYFKEQACDVAVIEVGLGGRLDSTNVLEAPLACLIGAPGFDHMDRLGDTAREIMGEKAGIVKPGCPVFAYAPEDAMMRASDAAEAREVLEARCAELDAPLTFYGYDDFTVMSYGRDGQTFRVNGSDDVCRTKMLGPYQPIYAMMAGSAAEATGMADVEAIRRGIATCIWPGRMEILADDPYTLLDGAHNVQGVLGLRETLSRLSMDQPVVMMLGVFKDKDHAAMARALFEDPPFDVASVVCTMPPGPRALDAEDLRREIVAVTGDEGPDVVVIRDVEAALLESRRRAKASGGMLCIAGSLYLAGAVRPIVRRMKRRA